MANAYGNNNYESTSGNASGMGDMADNVTEMASNVSNKVRGMDVNWMHAMSIGAFVAAGFCFFTGRRSAGFALASVGVATLASEHPDRFMDIWNNMPQYMERGTKMVDSVGGFVDKVSEQGAKFQQLKQQMTSGSGNPNQRPDYLT